MDPQQLTTSSQSIRTASAPERPSEETSLLRGYAVLMGTFGALLASTLALHRRRSASPSGPELALAALATHEIAGILTSDPVTRPLRTPFVDEVPQGSGETRERPRGRGLRRAVGELVTCPYCAGPWVATALAAMWAIDSRSARVVTGIFATAAMANTVHRVYVRLERQTQ